MNWKNILEAIAAFPSLVLEAIINSFAFIWTVENDLLEHGEFDEDDITTEQMERTDNPD